MNFMLFFLFYEIWNFCSNLWDNICFFFDKSPFAIFEGKKWCWFTLLIILWQWKAICHTFSMSVWIEKLVEKCHFGMFSFKIVCNSNFDAKNNLFSIFELLTITFSKNPISLIKKNYAIIFYSKMFSKLLWKITITKIEFW